MTAPAKLLPVLESGDRLTREEFHARYLQRTDLKKAELVLGVVYVASPVRIMQHGWPHGLTAGWVMAYCARHTEFGFGVDSTVALSDESEVQPDVCLFRRGEGASVRVTEDGYLEGAPELVVEIAASSASYDLHDKREAYLRAGVREYVVWQVVEARVIWFRLEGGAYREVIPGAGGHIESAAFPGLRLDVPALLRGDAAAVLAALA